MRISNNANKIPLALLVISVFAITPASAAIQYGSTSTEAPFAGSSTEKVGDLIKDFATTDINSETSVSAGTKFLKATTGFFVGINDWLAENAGINLFGILKTIGHWFVVFVEFLIEIIRKLI